MNNKSEEIFPIVDEFGNTIGKTTRKECHSGSMLLHPVVHLHVFDSQGKLFLQKRSDSKDIQPGLWDSSVGGHIDFGETPEIAVVREAREEINLRNFNPIYITKHIIVNHIERELTYCFYTITDNEISIDHDEVSDGRFWTIEEIAEHIGTGIFTMNFELDFNLFLSQGLDKLNNKIENGTI